VITTRHVLASILAAGFALAACGGGDGESAETTVPASTSTRPDTTTTTTSTSTVAPTAPPTLPVPTVPAVSTTIAPDVLRMPLTGEPLDDASQIPNRPAMAVKIDNIGSARPQSGLNEADIVIEEIINDGATRFAAVFHSQGVDLLGPVRSGRYPDIQLLEAFDRPLYVWSGGNAGVTYYIKNSKLVNLSAVNTSGYYRRSGRKAPHNLYTSTETMWEKTPEDFSIPPVVLPYLREGDTLTGDPANVINVLMDNVDVRWEFDTETGKYCRWQDGREHMTENSGQVCTDNLVVMQANYLQSPIDARTPDAQMLGSNTVAIFTAGTVRTGVWLRWESTDRYAFYDNLTDLNEIRLQPGRTFIELPRAVEGTVTWENAPAG
jgi:hypothetical protein